MKLQTIFKAYQIAEGHKAAAMRTGRKFIGIELDTDYFQIAETRIKNAAGDYVTTEKEKVEGKIALWDMLKSDANSS